MLAENGASALDAAAIERACDRSSAPSALRFSVEAFGHLESTNIVVKERARSGAGSGIACTALTQGGGYGRQGRTWASPLGGAYVSVFLKPAVDPRTLPELSLVASLAVRRAILAMGCADIRVKWPNDLMLSGGKVCGISLEALAGGACVGIGVNVFRPRARQDVGGKNVPVYVVESLDDVPAAASVGEGGLDDAQARVLEGLIARILVELGSCVQEWEARGLVVLLDEYREAMAWRGLFVEACDISGNLRAAGKVEGVDEQGRLLLRTEDGMVALTSGEVHLSAPTSGSQGD